MSARHRQSRSGAMGATKVDKDDRRLDHRRERHATRMALGGADLEDVVLPVAPHISSKSAPEPSSSGKRFRHWKQPFWKRRTALAHQRNVEMERIFRLP